MFGTSTSASKKKTNQDEDERTSLLASSSAPPVVASQPSSSQLLQQQQQQQGITQSQLKISNSTLEEMERGAKRLASENIGDSDSINGLLAGMETDDEDLYDSDVELEGGGGVMVDADGVVIAGVGSGGGGGRRKSVTHEELEFLVDPKAAAANKRVSIMTDTDHSSTGGGANNNTSSDSAFHLNATMKQKSYRMVDEIGNQLLNAQDNPMEERRILRKSLNLGALGILPNAGGNEDNVGNNNNHDDDDEEAAEEDEEGQLLRGEQELSSAHLTQRISESTRALRASVRGRRPAEFELEEPSSSSASSADRDDDRDRIKKKFYQTTTPLCRQVTLMFSLTLFIMLLLALALLLGTMVVGPPRQPVGEYKIIEAQVGEDFWQYWEFYAGKDSAGSNGYNLYVSQEAAAKEGIVKVVTEKVERSSMIEVYEDDNGVDGGGGKSKGREVDWLQEDLDFLAELKRKKEKADEKAEEEEEDDEEEGEDSDDGAEKTINATENNDSSTKTATKHASNRHLQPALADDPTPPRLEPFNPDIPPISSTTADEPTETFVIIGSSPTDEGPRNSVRLEGHRRFNRGLFIIDLRHMPAGCGTWPAFWLTDEANWPVNGEIDIVEGVNYQDTAKTALHSTKECRMDDVPEGSKTGSWDTSVGIPDKKTGIPDMTFRYAQDCFVYDPHQWLNQGCVATDLKLEGRSLGVPLNDNGGGVYALEWDPVNRHIRTWVFSPHGRVPSNLRDALRTATSVDEDARVAPDTNKWGLPYGHFPIGDGTNCPADHFRNMRLVINLAFCGSVSGNRYFMDCPKQFKKFKTCNEWVDSNPEELKQAYWKIRGVYVYEREWQKQWT